MILSTVLQVLFLDMGWVNGETSFHDVRSIFAEYDTAVVVTCEGVNGEEIATERGEGYVLA